MDRILIMGRSHILNQIEMRLIFLIFCFIRLVSLFVIIVIYIDLSCHEDSFNCLVCYVVCHFIILIFGFMNRLYYYLLGLLVILIYLQLSIHILMGFIILLIDY